MQTYSTFRPTDFDVRGVALDDRQDWLVVPVGTNRDADALTRSNWRVVTKDIKETATKADESDTFETHSFGHWACGWFEIMIVKPDTAAAACAEEWEAALSNYPVASDDDFSDEEYTEALEVWRNCYSSKQRLEYIRNHRDQFERCNAKWYPACEAWRSLLANVRGESFDGYASELLS